MCIRDSAGVAVEVGVHRLQGEVEIVQRALHLQRQHGGALARPVRQQDAAALRVAQPLHGPGHEQPDPLGGVGRVGDREVGLVAGRRGQAEAQVGPAGAHVEAEALGLLADVGQDALVQVDHGDLHARVDHRDRQRGQVVVADAEQPRAGQPEPGAQQQSPAHDRLGRRRHVVERLPPPRAARDQLLHALDHAGVAGEQVGHGIGREVGALAEQLAVGARPLGREPEPLP